MFADMLKRFRHIPWKMFTCSDEETGIITVLGTHAGTHSGQLVLLSGKLVNNLDPTDHAWLHVATCEGAVEVHLSTGQIMRVGKGLSATIPLSLFNRLESPAWYGYILTETVR